jgi:hypothetical protein
MAGRNDHFDGCSFTRKTSTLVAAEIGSQDTTTENDTRLDFAFLASLFYCLDSKWATTTTRSYMPNPHNTTRRSRLLTIMTWITHEYLDMYIHHHRPKQMNSRRP